MEELKCPLCCGSTFTSKKSLIEHISEYKSIECPICLMKCSSVEALSQHLDANRCRVTEEASYTDDDRNQITIHFEQQLGKDHTYTQLKQDDVAYSPRTALDVLSEQNDDSNTPEVGSNHDEEETEMSFVELMNKPLSETFEMEKMQLMDASGENRYIIVAQNDGTPTITSGSIVAKQNADGTVSINNVEDPLEENDEEQQPEEPVISVIENNLIIQKELYTCNSCGINFSSVLEHIQNFHKNEDVVVEVNEGSENAIREETKMETEVAESGSVPKRVITASGCIVEKLGDDDATEENKEPLHLGGEVLDNYGRVFTRRYVPVDTTTEVKQEDNTDKETTATVPEKVALQKAPYHQVVVKDMVTVVGGQKIKVYYCTACHTYVSDLNDFKSHPCKFLKYTCMDCPASYETAKSLYAHMKIHGPEKKIPKQETKEGATPEGPFRCEVCDTVFMSNKSLKLHKRMHVQAKLKPIEPPVSVKTDGSEPVTEKYFCPLCSKWIPTDYRDVHDNFHDKCEKFNCDICNKKFESYDYLVMHMNVHNMDKAVGNGARSDKDLPYCCLYCARRFARPHEKVKHERIHTGEKPHSCEICGKSFRVSYCLTLHMRTHTGARPYECHHCGKRFKAHSVYNHHLLTHSDVRAYKCPYCPKAFKTSVQLAGHKNSHTKPFSCKECNRPFASLYAVRMHTETHRRQNNLKYCCKLCGASYARTFALKDHMKLAHKYEVEAAENSSVKTNNAAASGWMVVKDENTITEFGIDEVETEEALISSQ